MSECQRSMHASNFNLYFLVHVHACASCSSIARFSVRRINLVLAIRGDVSIGNRACNETSEFGHAHASLPTN